MGFGSGSWKIALPLVAALIGVSACGGDEVESGGESAEQPSAESAVEPIKVAVIGDVTSTAALSWSGIPKVIEAKAEQINAAGGIGGRPIELVECDLQNLPDQAVACSRKAIDEGSAVALVQIIAGGQKVPPIMEQGKTAYLPASTSSFFDLESPSSFPLSTNVIMTIGAGYLAGETCDKPVVVGVQNPTFDSTKELITMGLSAAGKPTAEIVTVPAGAIDWAPTVAQLTSEDPDCIVPIMTESVLGAFYPALIQADWKTDDNRIVGFFGATYSPGLLDEFPEIFEGGVFANISYPYTDPQWDDFDAILESLPNADQLTNLTGSWTRGSYMNFLAFVDIAERLTEEGIEVNNETVLEKFSTTVDVDTDGLMPPIDTSAPFDDRYGRMFNRSILVDEFRDGSLVSRNDGEVIDLTELVAAELQG